MADQTPVSKNTMAAAACRSSSKDEASTPNAAASAKKESSVTATSPSATNNNNNNATAKQGEDDGIETFTAKEQADAARKTALQHFNKGEYEDALKLQCGILEFYTHKFGELNEDCALPYLDYGVTLLAIIASRDAAEALVDKEAAEEDMELCFENLDAARICFEKQEKVPSNKGKPEFVHRLVEVHDALAQLSQEGDKDAEAVQEYEKVIAIAATAKEQTTPITKLVMGAHYSAGLCHMRNENYEDAEKYFGKALELAHAHRGIADKAMLSELKDYLEEANEYQKEEAQAIDDIKEEIRGLFPDETSQVSDPEEMETKLPKSGLFSSMPGAGNENSSSLMMPTLFNKDGAAALGGLGDHSNSVSLFPVTAAPNSQSQHSRSGVTNQPVNVVQVRKKAKQPASGDAQATAKSVGEKSDEPQKKKHRTTSSQ